jgi:hypothetical protein
MEDLERHQHLVQWADEVMYRWGKESHECIVYACFADAILGRYSDTICKLYSRLGDKDGFIEIRLNKFGAYSKIQLCILFEHASKPLSLCK